MMSLIVLSACWTNTSHNQTQTWLVVQEISWSNNIVNSWNNNTWSTVETWTETKTWEQQTENSEEKVSSWEKEIINELMKEIDQAVQEDLTWN